MLLPRELDMTQAGRHMPLPVPKPKVLELIEVNKHDKGKVDSATDEDRQRHVGIRKPSPRDCQSGSGVDCGRKSAPSVAVTSKRLATTSQGPADGNQWQQQQQQQGQKERLAQQPQPGVNGRRPDQQQGKSHRPQQPQPLQATAGGEPQQAATERRGPRQKQQPPTTEAVAPQQKQQLPAVTINRWHGASAAITAVEQTKT